MGYMKARFINVANWLRLICPLNLTTKPNEIKIYC